MTITQSLWNRGIKIGSLGGAGVLCITLVGMIESFDKRDIIAGIMPMGITLALIITLIVAYIAAKKTIVTDNRIKFINAMMSGLVTSAYLAAFVMLGKSFPGMREVLVAASPMLFKILTANIAGPGGILIILLAGTLTGAFAGFLFLIPELPMKTIINTLIAVLALAMLQDLLRPILSEWSWADPIVETFFSLNGLTVKGAILAAIIFCVLYLLWSFQGDKVKTSYGNLPQKTQKNAQIFGFAILAVFLIILPQFIGLFLSEVLTIVGLYVLLGLGLNIVVGYAGLLDLGYVAFFAIGSYVTAILTSPEIFSFGLNFWQALPIAVLLGILAGVMLGIPVLKMRGDYLAIATLGFGEIIRILVLSDFLRPYLGGAQGIGSIPNPSFAGFEMVKPQHIYYLILAGCILVVFISTRLKTSRLGRAWMAMREDEDVAQAMGINLVSTKLLAFATGAGFSALSGAIFASKIGSVYPHSFNVFISINVVCLIIIGGIGSLPGVIVGAAVLMGLPELLREFNEYRMFVYGAALVIMMLLRPEGLWPEARHKMELHSDDENNEPQAAA